MFDVRSTRCPSAPPRPRRPLGLAVAAVALVAAGPAAHAAPPQPAPGAVLRLISAGTRDGRPDLGLEIALAPGWKTFWRTPGDSGIPPTIDSAASRGLAGLEVRYPVPARFGDPGAESLGYVAPVILPLEVTPRDPARPVALDLKILIGICHDVCLPLEAHLTLDLATATADPDAAARLAAARATVPVAAGPADLPDVVRLTRDRTARPETITVELAMPPGPDRECDVLVEGPDPTWALPQPEKVAESAGRELWRFALDGVPSGGATDAAPLRFTVRWGDRAVERVVRLDVAAVTP
ncbi:hypothetical protein EYW49_16995 [Siculibacillus lacustris]|uniref:Thiol:disulfide interchange protein DsbD N-terminal domain-containing protein n=1 Tax=Siculibacillus lacustris TaxID=1549641 RepID=A0A4V2KSZ0_9HYPH|nr:protein-disulfide reductase DsbD domain-containing protein [Siculibacillus lacustris]TBW34964.1 hypothetical protein EYW49_16995 [Siculibacillus lacustris]